MTHHSITYLPRAEVSFTREDLDLLMECSTHHYDGVCKSLSDERDYRGYPGLIRGMLNALTNGFDSPRTLTFRELDTLAKTLEIASWLPEPKAAQAFALRLAIKSALVELNESGVQPKVMT